MTLQPCFPAFCKFAKAHVESWDVDPMYPVLRDIYKQRDTPKEAALWHTFLYVTWYNIGSAEGAFSLYHKPRQFTADSNLPTGIERRGFRGNQLAAKHINAMLAMKLMQWGSIHDWVEGSIRQAPDRKSAWNLIREQYGQLPYGGNWSSYKWADLLKNVHGYPITAADIGVGGGGENTGPLPGMGRVTGEDWKRCARDTELQQELYDECLKYGVPFDGLDQMETSLCDFNSLCKGSYYVGADIDMMMGQLEGVQPIFWEARKRVFKPQYLGEVGGWNGVRKELLEHYLKTGEVLT